MKIGGKRRLYMYCWNAMISGLALHGYGQAALRLFDGLVEEDYQIFESTEDFGVLPKMEHYACMVDLLGRVGLLDLAYSFMKAMSFEPGAVLGALLSSCLVHGDAELAETVSKHIIDKAGCLSDGEYMMLSNMFALHGRWKEADNWRRMMKEAGISKVAGCSTIEINGRMYKFLAGDGECG
ncbi:PREDICTED: putative pentatricopeptide repeat-containing protein At5g59200, chloroplastic isoform X2 [Nelumbo nucifera]|uniref:Pentatricopeptide repeat-containing protein At5g59200, chloroplastic isoform X2 n=1 Tax=Nelumbo nucifera TaxID=4432 RepID=A0A1U8A8D9_NELNU|nr:PREDICTED: putative pentatricopeptide repeat-containing protein At5g59200, chloroplastic isoform X2 [Nelumbo nucifera]